MGATRNTDRAIDPGPKGGRHRVESGTVLPVEGWGFMVKSRTTGGWWLVDNAGCDCPAKIRRCFHVRKVEDHVRGLEARYAPRPAGKVNPGLFVD